MWRQTSWLVKQEIKNKWLAFLLTAVMVILLGLFTVMLLDQSLNKEWGNPFIFDLIFIGLTPYFAALFMSGPYLSLQTIQSDPFTKTMGFYRSIAIPFEVLVLSRTVIMLINLLIMSAFFYATIFLALPESFVGLYGKSGFLIFALIWFGYALVIGGGIPFVEYGTSGKMLYVFTFIITIALLIFIILFSAVFKIGIVDFSLQITSHYGWYAVGISILMGCIACYLWHKLLAIRLSRRDYV